MIVTIVFNKIKHLFLFFVSLFRRALCCFRRRRRSSFDGVPLTHVGVVSSKAEPEANWAWEDKPPEPRTIQDHIDLYRKRAIVARQSSQEPQEEENLFEDMTPRITRQTKVLVGGGAKAEPETSSNRLNFSEAIAPVEGSELQEWEENSGWEGETLDWDAQEALREKKRQDRERRLWEQQQKRLEKLSKSLGARVST